jgi:quercetin dioxygenase-like cupin family protein
MTHLLVFCRECGVTSQVSDLAGASEMAGTKMSDNLSVSATPGSQIPADDLRRLLTLAQPDKNKKLVHLGVVGDTYTILLTGDDTAGRFCLIDMHVPPGGGPPPHRHDFEETFIILDGELALTFRGNKIVAKAGDTVHIPASAPHQFHNSSPQAVRMLCLCSPAGQEKFFLEVGVPVDTRATPPPKLSKEQQEKMIAKMIALARKYRTELLKP